uniref:Uncharacterized protein n=1 Tax=Clytia hemisphaerica TaxID=252671 RepID=A0A7M5VEJ6_9CNID
MSFLSRTRSRSLARKWKNMHKVIWNKPCQIPWRLVLCIVLILVLLAAIILTAYREHLDNESRYMDEQLHIEETAQMIEIADRLEQRLENEKIFVKHLSKLSDQILVKK